MGKRIIQQARGHGSLSYRVRRRAFLHRVKYPMQDGEAEVLELIHSAGHSAPLMKVKIDKEIFFTPAFNGTVVGQKIKIGGNEVNAGNILTIKNIPLAANIYNIELNPGDGGRMMRAAGCSAILFKKLEGNKFAILMPNKKEVILSGDCRATIGTIAGSGKNLKPFITAGKMNAVDHPFGSGRGKRIKSKIAKRNAPPGARVGHIRPRRTGRRK